MRAYNWQERRRQGDIEKERLSENVAGLRLRKEKERLQRRRGSEVADKRQRQAFEKVSAAITHDLLGLSEGQVFSHLE